jgi:tetratricopeptide (TPR) repeat protein
VSQRSRVLGGGRTTGKRAGAISVLAAAWVMSAISGCHQTRSRPVAAVEQPSVAAPAAAAMAPEAADGLYGDLGRHRRPISTRSAEAQRAFDQALTLTFAFNHDEAIRLYGEAARLDPTCAMPWWGIAFANGPHINNPAMTPERSRAAWAAVEKARSLVAGKSPVERDLVEAVAKRYSPDENAERRPLDEAFAAAMRECWRAHPDDPDVGTVFAESMMDLRPWDLWTHDGKPKPGTEEIVATLEHLLRRWPDHPGANHLYIHAVEASPDPARAVPAADRLLGLVPDASHLVHMPSHIYARVGRYADASRSNEMAMAVDRRNSPRLPRAGFYRLYMAHNGHFLTFCSMMEGRREVALATVREMVAGIPQEFLSAQGPLMDGFVSAPLHVLIRFGRWDEILKEPAFPADLTVSNAIRHYARGIALAALGRLDEAAQEQRALAEAVARVDDRPIGNNKAKTVLVIPVKMLEAELAFRQGRHEESFAAFREAIAIEDQLVYDEPPDWMQPVRHALGASLLAAKRFSEAEEVFRADLRIWPENGWSLTGLHRCLVARGAAEESQAVARRRDAAWARADVAIASPCFCQPGVAPR